MSKIGHNGPPVDGGYFKIWRSMLTHHKFGLKKPFSSFEALVFLLSEAQYKDGVVFNAGRRMELKRGSLLGAVSWLAHEFGWTPKKVRVWLDHAAKNGTLTLSNPGFKQGQLRGRLPNHITLCNYDLYQGEGPDEGQVNGQLRAGSGQVKGETKDLTKERKKEGSSYADHVPGLQQMNGTGLNLVQFIGRYAGVDEPIARDMLKNNIQAFGEPEVLEAFAITQADMAAKTIATPYKYLIACARKAKDRAGRGGRRSMGDKMREIEQREREAKR